MKTQIIQFFKRLFLLLVIVALIDLAIGETLRHYYFKQKAGPDSKTIYAVCKMEQDVLIFGSSRANHHYVANDIARVLKHSVYNTGRNGNFNLYSAAVMEAVLTRYTPKAVVIDIVEREFEEKPGSYDYLSSLLPFYSEFPEMQGILQMRSKFEKYKLFSRIYPYNSLFPTIAINNIRANDPALDSNGYAPLHNIMKREVETRNNAKEYKIDSLKVKVFEEMVDLCKQKGIAVFVFCSPYYDILKYDDPSLKMVGEICRKRGVPFWDYSRDKEFKADPNMFDDFQHLNDSSARRYSLRCADSIRRYL